eukprot:CAMPEP_0171509424 /NCGR_PEP_ID=MMETSP0958-20121227/14767_1 /TAXON_ID=87120 /ORGANISM="Aurantiochytrium limacinum, Strain ATCCMYA-1381" /LENGTH=83 /DNA_ID=CAMNT_0012046671 /DNA_START=195 /DNA_END=446 /DNA_ORIENTATION=-
MPPARQKEGQPGQHKGPTRNEQSSKCAKDICNVPEANQSNLGLGLNECNFVASTLLFHNLTDALLKPEQCEQRWPNLPLGVCL